MDIYDILDSNPTNLNISFTEFLRTHGATEYYKKGEVIVNEGEDSERVYIVLEGLVNITKTDNIGNDNIIAIGERGSIFGEMGVFLNLKRSATIVAKTDLKVIVLSNENFVNILKTFPDATFRLLKSLSSKLDHLNKKFINILNNKTMITVGTYILEQYESVTQRRGTVCLDMAKLMKRTGLEQLQATNALVNYKRLNIISDLNLDCSDIVMFSVNISVLKSYLNSICISPVI